MICKQLESDDNCFKLQDGETYSDRILQDSQDNHAQDNQDTYSRLEPLFQKVCDAIVCLDKDKKEELQQELRDFLNRIYREAIELAESSSPQGQKLAMLPPISKKRKTHGTKHFK